MNVAVKKNALSSRPLMLFAAVLVVLSSAVLLVQYALPVVLKDLIAEKISAQLGRQVLLESLELRPLQLQASVHNLTLQSANGKDNELALTRLDVELSAETFTRFVPVVSQLNITGLAVAIGRNSEGRLSVQDVIDLIAAQPASPQPARFAIHNIRVANTRFKFTDELLNNTVELSEIALDVPFVSSLPSDVKVTVTPRFSAKLEGSDVLLTAKVKPFENSLDTALVFTLNGLDLKELNPYLPRGSALKVASGQADASLQVNFSEVSNSEKKLSVEGSLTLNGVQLLAITPQKQNLPFLGFKQLDVKLAEVSPLLNKMHVAAIELTDAHVKARLNEQGLDFVQTLAAAATANPASSSASNTRPLELSIDRIALNNASVDITDIRQSVPAELRIRQISAEVQNFELDSDKPILAQVSLQLNQTADVKVKGSFVQYPLRADMDIDARKFPLTLAQFHLDPILNARIASGELSTVLNIHYDESSTRFRGRLSAQNFRLQDKLFNNALVKFSALTLNDINIEQPATKPALFSVGDISLNDLTARLILGADGRLNLQDILISNPSQKASGPVAATDAKPIIKFGTVKLVNGNINFSDHLVKPNFNAHLTGLTGSLSGYSNQAKTQVSRLSLKGAIDGDGKLSISGEVNPLDPKSHLDITARATGIEMTRLSPYAAKYAGYDIVKGKLSTTLKYSIQNGVLVADNQLFLDQLTFGQAVESPDATTLPVRLAVSILKNLKGEIDLDLPVSGSLSDPQFSIAGVVFKALGNVIVKAVTAPFRMLADLFGGAPEQMDHVVFAPGKALPTVETAPRLPQIVSLLKSKTELALEVMGHADTNLDTEGLKRERLERRLGRLWLSEQKKDVGGADELVIPQQQKARLLKIVYDQETFEKPKNQLGLNKSLPVEQMEFLILSNTRVTESDLKDLAYRRADNVKKQLLELQPDLSARVFLVSPDEKLGTQGPDSTNATQFTRVDFNVRIIP